MARQWVHENGPRINGRFRFAEKNRCYEMSSFDEKQATTLLKERPIEFVNYNKHQLSRVYPAGTRFDSSNFMPQVRRSPCSVPILLLCRCAVAHHYHHTAVSNIEFDLPSVCAAILECRLSIGGAELSNVRSSDAIEFRNL